MRCLAFIGISLAAIGAAQAGELNSAPLRGSRAYEAAPSYQIMPSLPPEERAPPPYGPPVVVKPATVAAVPGYAFEVGARYWYSTGKLAKDLYDDPRSSNGLNSRLTYDGLTAHSFEAFGRIGFAGGFFFKGNAGIAGLRSGTLNDEDFPPALVPYSSTLSDQRGGRLGYATVDFGYTFPANSRVNLAPFAGYGFIGEKTNAYGCTQQATNPFVCVPAITSDVLGISEDANWHAARLGLAAEFKLIDRLTLTAEAAWIPYARLQSSDTHWLRIGTTPGSFAGPISETGTGNGVQLEALLAYQVWDCFTIGLGGRYWRIESKGAGDLEQMVIGVTNPAAQPLNFITERYGAFVQGSYRFNL
jgi:hypothetical protein